MLVVLADQWRGQDQGWIGNADVATPRLDALAAAGVAVTGAVANHPVCGPSRGDLLTGLFPHRHGVLANDLPLADDVPTVGEAFTAAGWRTAWIGKWHLDGVPRDAPVADGRCGFERFATVNCSHRYFATHYWVGGDRVAVPGYEPYAQTRLALDALRLGGEGHPTAVADDDRPALVVVSYGPPHDPYLDVPAEWLDRYDPDALTVRRNAADTADDRGRLAQYYAAISAIDDQLGVLVDALDAAGRLASTLILVLSDHGDMLGSQGRRAKQVPWAEAVRVPMVWHWPDGLTPRRLDRGFVGIVDVAPTLIDLIGAPGLPASDGRSVADALTGAGELRERIAIGNTVAVDEGWRQGVGEWRGYVDADTTYARHADGTPWLLYADAADPWQVRNLVDEPAAADRLAEADRTLDALLAETGDRTEPAPVLIERLGLVERWNERERELHGEQGRLLAVAR